MGDRTRPPPAQLGTKGALGSAVTIKPSGAPSVESSMRKTLVTQPSDNLPRRFEANRGQRDEVVRPDHATLSFWKSRCGMPAARQRVEGACAHPHRKDECYEEE